MSNRSPADPATSYRYILAVALILLVAAAMRFYGQNWDDGHYFHPDERFIATVMSDRLSVPHISDAGSIFNPSESPLNTRSNDDDGNPREFAYGSLPFLVATFLGAAIGLVVETDLTAYENVAPFGRTLTTLVDLGTIAFVILFGWQAFGRLAGVIAGALTATAVVLIQLAHFFTVDTWVTFFTIAVLYASLRIVRGFELKWSLIAAGLGGAALATKMSVGVLGIPIIVATVLGARSLSEDWSTTASRTFRRLAISSLPAIGVFAIFEPYAIWRPGPFIDDIRAQWEIVNGHNDIPFTRQFVGTIAGVNEIENLVLWGVAPGFGLAAIVAVLVGTILAFRDRDPRYLLLMSWIVPYFYVIASSEARFLRYSAPLVPPLAVMVGHQLSHWWGHSTETRVSRALAAVTTVLVVGITLFWALAFMNVYRDEHPRIEASEWIYANVEPGAALTREIWDDTLPVHLETGFGGAYEHISMDLYGDRPNEEAFAYIADVLAEADYIVLASQRLSHSIPRLPWRYPIESAYYRLLEEEQLGFELAHESTSYPGFGSVRINTLRADESFSVYDHPPVRVFRKVDDLSRDELELRFAHALNSPWIPARQTSEPTLLLDAPVGERPVANDVGWSSAATESTPVAIVVWVAAISVLGLAALPLSLRLFPGFADLGTGLSPILGILGAGIFVWLFWSFEIAPFTIWTILLAALGLGAIAWLAVGVDRPTIEVVRKRWPLAVMSLAVFLAVFAFFLLLRSSNPDLWHPTFGGEKPMETAYLNAIARSESFPPFDPWFADGYINYYYYGFFLIAMLWKITGVPPDLGFQLALATIAGLLASGVFSIASTLTHGLLPSSRAGWIAGGGIAAILLTLYAGNLDAFRQVMRERELAVDFWQSSRVVEFAINEFPYFSFLYGDLHPHLIAAPFLVLVLALAYAWIQQGRDACVPWVATWSIAVAIAVGSVTFINFWDGPTAGIVIIASMTLPLFHARGQWRRGSLRAALLIPLIGVVAWVLFQPFHSRLYTPTDGLELTSRGTSVSDWFTHFGLLVAAITLVGAALIVQRVDVRPSVRWRLIAAGGALAAGSALVASTLSGAGLNLSMLLTLIAVALAGALTVKASEWFQDGVQSRFNQLLLLPFVALGGALAPFRPVAAISAFLVALLLLLWLSGGRRPAHAFLAICGACAAGLILVADVVYVTDHLRDSDWERMNTVFKLYFQSWTLFALVAGVGLVWLLNRSLPSNSSPGIVNVIRGWRPIAATTALLGIALLALAYPVLATGDRLDVRMNSTPENLTLSGYEWMNGGTISNQAGDEIDFTGDFHAVQWLLDETSGNDVILEAAIGPYRGGGSRISSATGLPTVIGWDSHQSQQRGSAAVQPRSADVRELYQTQDVDRKRYLLRQYRVDYIIVGDVERYAIVGGIPSNGEPDYYSSTEGLEAFDAMVGTDLEIAFNEAGTTIYRVVPFPSAGQGDET